MLGLQLFDDDGQNHASAVFRDTSVSYPDDTMVLGRDLGPAIDIGPAMTWKILKANGKVVYRSTV